ncbi:hypothetical protein DAPPUDRAFT_247281 [Daphnia pulex]|uniref:Uncharacterized protein n=1 Tax=Daphnia pulex TaxID=6669 RepID=E9GS56_DAPPU|nr:hypothetical protein DAPPUDRAFT_247281 [Daphnia pulex]|eukprot:EFX77654.1 hypothetical protein DAPPUDRAFT_247281 [Daphnia pulex]
MMVSMAIDNWRAALECDSLSGLGLASSGPKLTSPVKPCIRLRQPDQCQV